VRINRALDSTGQSWGTPVVVNANSTRLAAGKVRLISLVMADTGLPAVHLLDQSVALNREGYSRIALDCAGEGSPCDKIAW
jgi:hypothetical protein